MNILYAIKIAAGIFTLAAGFLTALWAYTIFILERGLLPPVQFFIECKLLGTTKDSRIVELQIHLNNVGTATFVAKNIRLDIRYLNGDSHSINLFDESRKIGRLNFPGSLANDLGVKQETINPQINTSKASKLSKRSNLFKRFNPSNKDSNKRPSKQRGFSIIGYDTFVQPNVDQAYSFVTALPKNTDFILAWSSFEYAHTPNKLQEIIFGLSRFIGLIQYSLQHTSEPHTVEHAFDIRDVSVMKNTVT